MFRRDHLIKTMILIFAWITSCISFYALGLNSTDLSGNIFQNFFLTRHASFINFLRQFQWTRGLWIILILGHSRNCTMWKISLNRDLEYLIKEFIMLAFGLFRYVSKWDLIKKELCVLCLIFSFFFFAWAVSCNSCKLVSDSLMSPLHEFDEKTCHFFKWPY